MKHPQVVVFEPDGLLAHYLDEVGVQKRWWHRPNGDRPADDTATRKEWLLRESRQVPACLTLLRTGGPAVLVLKVGRNLVRELTLLDQVHAAAADCPVVVVGDAEDDALAVLAYELGAAYVLLPPEPRQHLADLVEALLISRIDQM